MKKKITGGTILKMIGHCGWLAASRYYFSQTKNLTPNKIQNTVVVMARIEQMAFHKPMFIAEIAHLEAVVTYTSPHSMEVAVMLLSIK